MWRCPDTTRIHAATNAHTTRQAPAPVLRDRTVDRHLGAKKRVNWTNSLTRTICQKPAKRCRPHQKMRSSKGGRERRGRCNTKTSPFGTVIATVCGRQRPSASPRQYVRSGPWRPPSAVAAYGGANLSVEGRNDPHSHVKPDRSDLRP